MNDSSIKHKLLDSCRLYVEQRISTAREAMSVAQAAANEEDKSSAGDKYETGRAMMHIEREKAAEQLDVSLKLKMALDQISLESAHEQISVGCVAITSAFKSFIAFGPGKIKIDNDEYFIVTPGAPLGKLLLGLKVGQEFTFNNSPHTVLKIF